MSARNGGPTGPTVAPRPSPGGSGPGRAGGAGSTAVAPAAQKPATPGRGVPRLVEGVELIGEYEGSGFEEPPSLVRRPDGQVIQLTNLLYLVASHADGRRGYGEIAREVGRAIGRRVTPDNVRVLVEDKLRPLGVMVGGDGSAPPVEKLDPLLALKFRAAVVPERVSQVLAAVGQPLFSPVLVLAALAGLVAADVWLFLHHGVAQSLRETLYQPGTILLVMGAVVASAAVHEVGHAAACAYGGGRPGRMGCGLYLAWPAFYTDVTDAYRLGRRGRLRTDLGGVYFNVVFILGTLAAYALTGFEPLLLLIVLQHFEIVHQLLPLVRLDGYYIVADLTGVPDLFNRIRPILASLVPGRPPDDRVTVLKRWVRVAVTVWVLVVVPLLLFQLFMLLVHLPRILGTAWDSLGRQMTATTEAFGDGNALAGAAGIVQILALCLPVIGIVLLLGRLVAGGGRALWRGTDGRPALRLGAVAATAAAAALLAMAWLPGANYEPIRPGERGTLHEGIVAVRRIATGRAPLTSKQMAADRGELGPPPPGPVVPATTGGPDAGAGGVTTATTTAPSSIPTSGAGGGAGATAGSTAGPTTTTRSGTSTTSTTTRATTTTDVPTTSTTTGSTTTTEAAPTTTTTP